VAWIILLISEDLQFQNRRVVDLRHPVDSFHEYTSSRVRIRKGTLFFGTQSVREQGRSRGYANA